MRDPVSNRPRLLYIDDIPTPYRVGVQRRVAELWDGSFKVVFCAESEPGRSWDLDLSGIDHAVLPGRQWRPKGQTNPFSFKYNPGVVRLLETYKPDVVVLAGYAHPTMIRAALWCRRNNVPYGVSCETSARSTATSGPRWHLRRRLIGWMIRNMAFGLPVGREAGSYLQMLGAGDVPMCFFPNTPDTSRFVAAHRAIAGDETAAVNLRDRYGLSRTDPVFLFVGRLIGAKRPMDAVTAFRQLGPEARANLLIVGDGALKDDLKAAASGDERIVFGGWISDPDEIAALFATATAMILPSQHEPWGAVVNEAMAAGTPVIASDRVGAANEIIDDGFDGFVIPVGDIDGIVEAMSSLLKGGPEIGQMGRRAQDKAISNGEVFAASNLVNGAQSAMRS